MEHDRTTLVIATSDDLAALERDLRTMKRRRIGQIDVQVPGLKPEQQTRLARDISRGYFACGCAEATALGLLGLVAGAGFAWSAGMIPAEWLKALGLGFGGFAAGVSLGKFAGKRLALLPMARAVAELRSHFGPEELPPEKPTAICAVHAH